jgi:hypothetical protein
MPKPEDELDFDGIAKALGAKRMGKVHVGHGYFGALETLEAVHALRAAEKAKQDAKS